MDRTVDFKWEWLDEGSGNDAIDKPFFGDKDVKLIVDGLTVRSLKLALAILDRAQTKVPVDTGFLKSSGKVVRLPDGYEVVYDAPYAIYVHDAEDYVKFKVGQSKYLEEAFYEIMYGNIGGGIL